MTALYEITPLGFDACSSDASAPCRYWHLKRRAMVGEQLPEVDLRFCGFAEECPDRGGWQDASNHLEVLYRDQQRDLEELSSEDSAMLSALMAIETVDLNRERLDFIR